MPERTDVSEARRAVLERLAFLRLLPEAARAAILDRFVAESHAFGAEIVRQGAPATALYVLAKGRVRVVRAGPGGEEVSLATLRAGESFGESGLREQETSPATVRASSDVELLRLDGGVWRGIVAANPQVRSALELEARYRALFNFFRHFTPFAELPVEALRAMLDGLTSETWAAGTPVIRQGEPPGPMYVVEEGRLRVYMDGDGPRRNIAFLRKGDFFGEMSILKRAPRSASVETVSECRLLVFREETFRELLARFPALHDELAEHMLHYDYKQVARVPLDFAEEMLPLQAEVREKVSADQVEADADEGAGAAAAADAAPFASEDGHFVKRGRRIRRFPHVFQIDEMDCGAACLGMICRHFGRNVSLSRIRALAHTDTEGTSLRGLCLAGNELGLASRSAKASKRNLDQMPLPAVVHWEGNHWVVLWDVERDWVRIADPALGNRRLPRAEFEARWTGYAALFDYTDELEKVPEGRTGIAWMRPFFRPFHGLFAQAAALALLVSVLQMALPVFTQVIVDKVLVERDQGLLDTLLLGMLGVLAFLSAATLVQRYLLSFAAARIDARALDYLTRRLLSLPMSYFATRRTGDIQRRLQGIRLVREYLAQNGVAGLTAGVQLLCAVALMLAYSPKLALVFLALTPVYIGFMAFSRRRLRPLFDDLEEAFGKYGSYQIDAIKGIETVKALAAEYPFRERMLAEFHRVAGRQFRADFMMMSYGGAVQAATFLSVATFLWVGAGEVLAGRLTIGTLVAFNSLVALANGPVTILLRLWDELQFADVLLNRLSDVVEQEPEQGEDRSRLVPVRTLEGRIQLENVGFRYGGVDAPMILSGLTLDVPAGKTIAIIGRSGSGKTTLIKLLAGLLEPTEGTIRFDGLDLKTLNYRDLRRHIGCVLQENHLFDDTIARNIAFGLAEPDMDRVLWAARAAAAQDFIERLPLAYDTRVGESGIGLSGGQRQRVAIARALYHRPPVLIFDEATSALDTESEKAVKESIDRLLEGRTAFVIAHRLSTIRDADLILVLEKGRIVERGTHEELIARQGLYYYLSSQQMRM